MKVAVKEQRKLSQNEKQHMRRKGTNVAVCGVKLTYKHLIYTPQKGHKIRDMSGKYRVCWKCIEYSGVNDTHKW